MSKVSINVFGHQRRGFEAIHVSIFKVNFKISQSLVSEYTDAANVNPSARIHSLNVQFEEVTSEK